MIIAVTGGIGSGKSYVSQLLRNMGHEVYDCDQEAKRLMTSDTRLINQLKDLLGNEAYLPDGNLNKPYISHRIFNDSTLLQRMNQLVHPAVARDFLHSGISFIESAILFEAAFDQLVHPDKVWCVAAPLELRIERTMKRDGVSREQVLARINNQLPQEEKMGKSDVVIWNDDQHLLSCQLEQALANLPL